MLDPLFWLGISLLLVSLSLSAVLVIAIPTLQQISHAARSAEKLFDTLNKEFPPTLEAIRLTSSEINQLTEEIDRGVESATGIVKQADRTISNTTKQVETNTRSLAIGIKTAWRTWREKR